MVSEAPAALDPAAAGGGMLQDHTVGFVRKGCLGQVRGIETLVPIYMYYTIYIYIWINV